MKKIGRVVMAILLCATILLSLFGCANNGRRPIASPQKPDTSAQEKSTTSQTTVVAITESDFFYHEKSDTLVLVFELSDKNLEAVVASGTAEIKIVNDDGVAVYYQTHNFTKNDFTNWAFPYTYKERLVTIRIDPNDVQLGGTASGSVHFAVRVGEFAPDVVTLRTNSLPTKSLNVTIPQLPKKVHYRNYDSSICTSVKITDITYEIKYDDSLYIYFTGEKTYDEDGKKGTNLCWFKWKLYDLDGYLLDSGSVMISNLTVGDKFKDQEGYAFACVEPGGSYKIVIEDY